MNIDVVAVADAAPTDGATLLAAPAATFGLPGSHDSADGAWSLLTTGCCEPGMARPERCEGVLRRNDAGSGTTASCLVGWVAVLTVALCGCAGGSIVGQPGTTEATAVAQTFDTTSTSENRGSERTSPAHSDELETRIPGAEPAPDFRRQDEAEFDTGAKDKEEAIRDERQDSEAQQLLGTVSFEAGYQRLWQRPDRSQVLVIVYEFRSERDADTWAQTKERTERAMSPASEDFDLEVPDSSGVFSVVDNWRNWSVMFRVSRYWVRVIAGTYSEDDLRPVAVALAQTLHGRLL